MARAKRKNVEKFGEVIGKSRPILGTVLAVAGLAALLSVLGYTAGQEVLFKHYFEPLLPSTDSAGNNVCGKLGATFALASMLLVGASAYMIPVYIIWAAVGCFRRRASLFSKTEIAAIFAGLLSLSVSAAVFQDFLGTSAPLQSATFPSGWGGKFGYVVYSQTKPLLDTLGNALLFGSAYFITLVVVFVESPAETASELFSALKWCARMMWKAFWVVAVALFSIPKKLVVALFARRSRDDEEDEDAAQVRPAEPARAKAAQKRQSDAEELSDADFAPDSETASVDGIDLGELSAFVNEMKSADSSSAKNESGVVEIGSVDAEMLDASEDDASADFSSVDIGFGSREKTAAPSESAALAEPAARAEAVSDSEAASDVPETINLGLASSAKPDSPSAEPQPQTPPAAEQPRQAQTSEIEVVDTSVPLVEDVPERKPRRKDAEKYVFPSLSLLSEPAKRDETKVEDYNARTAEIVKIIGDFGLKVIPDKAYPGPVITRYEVKPAPGVKISRIANLEDDITAGIMAEKVRIIAPVPGRGTIGIEVPNKHRMNVTMREVLQSKQWRDNNYEIPIALGKDATGIPIVANMKKMTHALIAGSTNSGKSVCINTIIISMLYKMTPRDLRLIMIDPKMVELQVYNTIPHMLIPVVVDVKKAAAALKWLTGEMMRRYQIFNKAGVRNIDGFNAKILKDKAEMERAEMEFAQMSSEERQAAMAAKAEAKDDIELPEDKLPYIVCIIDELADLMSVVGKDVELYIARITQLARAAGIHMIIATQRPDVKVITGKIKNNLPTRIAFKVTSQIDSRTILDRKGAETLIGQGDMLFLNNGSSDLVRAQGAFIPDAEIAAVVEALNVNNVDGKPQYVEEVQAQIEASDDEDGGDLIGDGEGGKYGDPMTVKAINAIRASGKASTSLLQRKLGIGYGRAARIMDELEDRGIIGPDNGTGKRELFLDSLE